MSLLAGLLYADKEEFARRIAEVVRNEQCQAAYQDQQRSATFQEKLTQPAQRIEKLERKVAIQLQR